MRTAMMILTWAGIALAVLVILLIAWFTYCATSENACCYSDGGCGQRQEDRRIQPITPIP